MSLNVNSIGQFPSSSFPQLPPDSSDSAGIAQLSLNPLSIAPQSPPTTPPPLDDRVKKTNPFPLYPAIISILFQFAVSKKTEIVRFASVCHLFNFSMKHYHHVARFIEQTPICKLNLTTEQLMVVLKHVGKEIRTLDLKGLKTSYALLTHIVRYCPHLEKLNLTICSIDAANLPFAPSFLGMEPPEVGEPVMEFSCLRQLPRLKEINLTHSSFDRENMKQQLLLIAAEVGDKIHSLRLNPYLFSPQSEINEFLNQLIPNIPNLRLLDVNSYEVSTKQLANLTQLTELNLLGNKSDQIDSLLIACLRSMPHLLKLNVAETPHLSSEAFSHLPQGSKLQALNVRNCKQLEIHFFLCLVNLAGLQELDMRGLTITQPILESLTHHGSTLTKLCLDIASDNSNQQRNEQGIIITETCVPFKVIELFLSGLINIEALDFCNQSGMSNEYLLSLNHAAHLQTLILADDRGWGSQLMTRNFNGNWQELHTIMLSGFDIDETNVLFFKQLPKLRFLNLSMSRLTNGALQLLKEFDPEIEIKVYTITSNFVPPGSGHFSEDQIRDFYYNRKPPDDKKYLITHYTINIPSED